ncbi:hypothetical protein [Streptomyces sp. NPDC055681]
MTLNTILRYSRATMPEELFTGQWQSRTTKLDAYKPQPVGPRTPSARAVTRWLLAHPDALIESHRVQLKAALASCPELDALAQHVRAFAHMVTDLHGDQLP